MGILLTPEEIRATNPYWEGLSDNAVKRVRLIAKAQLKKVAEWLYNEYKNLEMSPETYVLFDKIRQALLKEVEDV